MVVTWGDQLYLAGQIEGAYVFHTKTKKVLIFDVLRDWCLNPLIFSLVLSQSRALSCVLISQWRTYRAKSSVFSTEHDGQLGLVETTEG